MVSPEVLKILALIISLMIAIIGHEIMHGAMALYYKDTTAKNKGRLSINPIVHIDPIGTILVPALLLITHAGFMFGWAKPVPVDMNKVFANARHKGAINVALAGIYYNFLSAFLAVIMLKFLSIDGTTSFGYFLETFLFYMVVFNLILGVFNLFPFPPLDGSKVLMYTLSFFGFSYLANKIYEFEKYGMILLMLIIATPLSHYILAPISAVIKLVLSL